MQKTYRGKTFKSKRKKLEKKIPLPFMCGRINEAKGLEIPDALQARGNNLRNGARKGSGQPSWNNNVFLSTLVLHSLIRRQNGLTTAAACIKIINVFSSLTTRRPTAGSIAVIMS